MGVSLFDTKRKRISGQREAWIASEGNDYDHDWENSWLDGWLAANVNMLLTTATTTSTVWAVKVKRRGWKTRDKKRC